MNDAINNPYRPPSAEVVDAPEVDERMERPQHVFHAVAMLWITLVIQAAGLAFMWRLYRIVPMQDLIWFGVNTAFWVFNAFLVAMIERGRNWARITYLVLFLMNLPFIVLSLIYMMSAFLIVALILLAQALLQITGIIMLFYPPAGAWFRGESAE